MLFATHIMLGIIFFLIARPHIPGNELIFFLIVLLGSILPDIDEPHSTMHRWSGLLGSFVTFFFHHRGIFHSLLFFGSASAMLVYLTHISYGVALLLGYLAHMIGDGITPLGLQPLYPLSTFKIRGPVKTGGFGERIFFILLVFLILKEFIT